MKEKLTEEVIVDRIIDFMINKENGNCHEEKVEKSELHKRGVIIKLVGGKRNSEYFFFECKDKSYAKSARSVNRAYKCGLGLYWESAQVALRRILKKIAEVLCLHIFAVNDNDEVKYFTPSKFGKVYTKDDFC